MGNLIKINFENNKTENTKDQIKDFNQEWINLLTENKVDKQREFNSISKISKSTALAVMEYRKLLMEQGRGQDIEKYELKLANAWGEEFLHSHLEELFLEPIPMWHIEHLKEVAKKKRLTIEEALDRVYDRHFKNSGARLIRIAKTL